MDLKQDRISIEGIPAIVWGAESDTGYIYVHGRMGSKEAARDFADVAAARGVQVLSFDLPEHGERRGDARACDVPNGVRDLRAVYGEARRGWKHIRLYAVSLGAYFALQAYRDAEIERALFLSPILDMEALIGGMMQVAGVSESELRERRVIPVEGADALDWAYYEYVRKHPIDAWRIPTRILWGTGDALTPRPVVEAFAARFGADVAVLEGGEHWFHTPEQLAVLARWERENA